MKKILIMVLCVLPFAGSAQSFLKKLKDKATEAATNTLIKKSQQIAEQKMDQATTKTISTEQAQATAKSTSDQPDSAADMSRESIKMANDMAEARTKLLGEGKYSTNSIVFELSKTELKQLSYGVLGQIIAILKENPSMKIVIIAHADSESLGLKQARATKQFMVNQGIDASRLQIKGIGATQFADNNKTNAGIAQNGCFEFNKL